jgi:chromosome segregation ATPase
MNHRPTDAPTDETSQAERIRRLEHRCDMEVAHIAELKEQLRAFADQCRAQHCEIGILRAHTALLKDERDEARQLFNQLSEVFADVQEERDEARRLYCVLNMRATGEDPMTPHIDALARIDADSRGWDCFKEDTK